MNYFNFNGKLLPEGTPVIGPDNRGLRYGDGLFETIKCRDNNLILLDEHLSRLWNGLKLFEIDIPKLFTPDMLQEGIHQLLKKNGLSDARIRLSVIRGNGSLYEAQGQILYIIQAWPNDKKSNWNENGLHAGIYRDAFKSADRFANCKHNNFLPYLMGALYAKKNKLNDAFILNNHGRICDSTIANIFLFKGDDLITPALTEGCVAGIMRRYLINELSTAINIREEVVTIEMLLNADEVFLTNSMFNIRWVASLENTSFNNTRTREIFSQLTATNNLDFC